MGVDENKVPWEQPNIKILIDMFNGSVAKVTPLNQVSSNISNNDDGEDRW